MRHFYSALYIVLFGMLPTVSPAQVTISTPDTTICPNSPLTLNASIGTNSGNFITFTDDLFSSVLNLGFSFTFYGTTYTQCVISSNGFVTFNTGNAGAVSPWNIALSGPVPGNPDCLNAIMGPYTDIDPSQGGSIEYSTQGTAPNRRFVVTYCDVPHYNCTNLLYTFQFALFETTNEIEFHIGSKPLCTNGNGINAIQGVHNNSGTQAVTVPGRNAGTNWSANNNSHKFTPSGGSYVISSIPFAFYPTGNNAISWYLNNSTVPFASGNTVTINPSTNGFYVARADGCFGFSADTVSVSVANLTQAPAVVSPISLCQGGPSAPLTATGVNIKWYATPTGGVGSLTPPTPSTANAGATTWYASQTIGLCEGPRAPLTVNVSPYLPPPTISNNGPICQGDTLQLSASAGSGATYQWTGPGGFTASTQNPTRNNITLAGAGVYTLNTAVNGCPSLPATTNVVVTPAPTVTAATSNSPICDSATLTLSASASPAATAIVWTGPNGFSATGNNPTIPVATVVNSGTYTVVASTNGCSSQPVNVSVTVTPEPALPTVSPVSLCQNGPTAPLTAVGQNLLWYTAPVGGVGATAAPTPPTNTPGTTTWYVSQTVGACQSNRAPVPVTVAPFSSPPAAANNGPICQGTSLQLTAASIAGATYSWTGPAGFVSAQQNPVVNNAQPANAGAYTVVASVNGCPTLPTTTLVIVNPTPVISNTSSNSPVCDGAGLTLSAGTPQPGFNYAWTGPNGYTATGASQSINPVALTDAGVYTVVATANGCSSASATLNVIVHPIPTTPTVVNDTFCQFTQATPLVAVGQNLLWYPTPIGGVGVPTAPTPPTQVAGPIVWYVSQTVNGCESPLTPVTATITAESPTPLTVTNVVYCQFDSAVVLSATGQNLLWYTTPSGGTPSTQAPLPDVAIAGSTVYYVTQNVTSCESPRLPITVLVYPKPQPPAAVSSLTYCEGDGAQALSATGQNLMWYTTATGGTGSPAAPTPTTNTASVQQFFVSESINGCESDRSPITVTVSPTPDLNLIATRYTVCALDTVTIVNTPVNTPATNYIWSFDSANVLSGSGAGPYLLSWNQPGTVNILLTASENGCDTSKSISLTVNPAVPTDFYLKSDACLNEVVAVQAAWGSLPNADYTWNFGDAQYIAGSPKGYNKIKWTTPGVKYVTLGISTDQCPARPVTDTIVVHAPPIIQLSAQTTSGICVGDSVRIQAYSPTDTCTFEWRPAAFFSAYQGDVKDARILSAGYVSVAATSVYGCTNADSLYFDAQPCCDVAVPSAFTPNGDGRNDLLRVITPGNQQVAVFRVVNRWGQTIYESLNQNEGWDGAFMGVPQPTGNYQYFLRYRCADGTLLEKKGDITLVR